MFYGSVPFMDDDKPLAYVIGDQPFLGLKIYLDSRPLIPRPETEWWTEQLVSEIFEGSAARRREAQQISSRKLCVLKNFAHELRFLDLCAGSGAIGCAALAKLPNAQVYFGEIDPAHEATIVKNIRENNLDESPAFANASAGKRAFVRIGDLFEPFGDMIFDIVAANPPYIPNNRVLQKSVADYEPAEALYAGADGLDVIRRIAEALPHHLAEDGIAWIECDSAYAASACALFQAQGFNTEIKNDQYGVPRIIVAHPALARYNSINVRTAFN